MDEKTQEKTEDKKPEESADNTGEGDKPEADSKIERANAAAERMEKANAEKTKLLNREEDLIAQRRLGGEIDAGKPAAKAKETDEEYTERFKRGEVNPLADDGAL